MVALCSLSDAAVFCHSDTSRIVDKNRRSAGESSCETDLDDLDDAEVCSLHSDASWEEDMQSTESLMLPPGLQQDLPPGLPAPLFCNTTVAEAAVLERLRLQMEQERLLREFAFLSVYGRSMQSTAYHSPCTLRLPLATANTGAAPACGQQPPIPSSCAPALRKTKMCSFHQQGRCGHGKACKFAHTPEELQSAPNLAKTRLCPDFSRGACKNKHCNFAHGKQELRCTEGMYKTQLCRGYTLGTCKFGSHCRFAHGEADLC